LDWATVLAMNAIDPKMDTTCSRCTNETAIWDIGVCWRCLDASLVDSFSKRVNDGSLQRSIVEIGAFLDRIRKAQSLSTETRREFLTLLENLKH